MQRKTIIKIILWILGLYGSTYFSFQKIYFILSGFYFMFTNFGKRQKGSLSAYSVFNQNFQRLHGTMDASNLFSSNREEKASPLVLQHRSQSTADNNDNNASKEQYFKNQSKYCNKNCYCGSGMKFKKCCLITERKRIQQEKKARLKAN